MCPLAYGLGAKFNETVSQISSCPCGMGSSKQQIVQHFNFYKEAIDHITITKGACKSSAFSHAKMPSHPPADAILDPHNYMRYNDPSSQPISGSVIGNSSDPNAATTEQFAAFWGELAKRFVSTYTFIS